jgi:hypothetical protein
MQTGHRVFIPAGSGGIGTFAIQLATPRCLCATTTSTANVALVKSLGADDVIDYKKQEFEEVLRGYNVVLGTIRGDTGEVDWHPQARRQDNFADWSAGRCICTSPQVELRSQTNLWPHEQKNHPHGSKEGRGLLVSIRAT